ncbi:MAG: endolytic transglycosylase MltG [Balneolaceae bacterium]
MSHTLTSQYLLSVSKKVALSIALFMFVFSLVFGSRYIRLYNPNAIVSTEFTVLYLEEPIGLDQLIVELQALDLQLNVEEFKWAASISGWKNFNRGRYEFSGGYSYEEILSKVARGLQDHTSVTVPPGVDIERLSQVLGNRLLPDSAEFADIFQDSSSLAMELDLDGYSLFCRMLPDTYNIYWTSSAEQVVRRILSQFNRNVIDRYSKQIEENDLNLDQILTLASIVEWEARNSEEKPRISGLYWNRLNRNMYLQADPTVIFAIGERRRLLFEDYRFEHPYNTYVNAGLPPGPITNPDISSIEAVLNPEDHDYLFMVATPEGGHIFNETFEQHQTASAEWRQWIREQYRIRDERERQLNK